MRGKLNQLSSIYIFIEMSHDPIFLCVELYTYINAINIKVAVDYMTSKPISLH